MRYVAKKAKLEQEVDQDESHDEEVEGIIYQSKELEAIARKDIKDFVEEATIGINKAQGFTKAHSGNGILLYFYIIEQETLFKVVDIQGIILT